MKFRVYLAGLVPRKEEWISFYTKNQSFRTVCRNCLTLKEIRTYLEGSKNAKRSDKSSYLEFTKAIKSSSNKPKKLHYDILKSQVRGSTKAILLQWHIAARAKLLHRKPAPKPEPIKKPQPNLPIQSYRSNRQN